MKGGAVLGQWLGGRSVGQLLDFLMLLKWTFMVGLGSNVYIAGLPVRGCFSPWLVYPSGGMERGQAGWMDPGGVPGEGTSTRQPPGVLPAPLPLRL